MTVDHQKYLSTHVLSKALKRILLLSSNDRLFHNLALVTVNVLPPSISLLYRGHTKLEFEYLVLRHRT